MVVAAAGADAAIVQATNTSPETLHSHIKSNETSVVTASNNKYYIYRYEGKLNDIENAVVLISWNKRIYLINHHLL